MELKLGFKKMGIIMSILMSIFILSCNKEEVEVSDVNTLKAGEINTEEAVCDLVAGQTIPVGNVTYSSDGTNLTVSYVTSGGWILKEVHLYVGSLDDFPVNPGGVKIGHFPYGEENLSTDTWSITVPIPEVENCIIAAHAVVYNPELGRTETGWANCSFKPVIALKTRFHEWPEGAPYWTWGATDGLSYIDHCKGGSATGNWCDYFGYNYYTKDDVYTLQSEYYSDAGDVTVTDDGENLMVTIDADYDMMGAWLFVGTMDELCDYALRYDDCPDFYNFPYKMTWVGPYSNTYTFTIPIADIGTNMNSVPFEDLGLSRWGWFSYCDF